MFVAVLSRLVEKLICAAWSVTVPAPDQQLPTCLGPNQQDSVAKRDPCSLADAADLSWVLQADTEL